MSRVRVERRARQQAAAGREAIRAVRASDTHIDPAQARSWESGARLASPQPQNRPATTTQKPGWECLAVGTAITTVEGNAHRRHRPAT